MCQPWDNLGQPTTDSSRRTAGRILPRLGMALAVACLAASVSAAGDESLAQLVQRLPTNSNSLPSDQVLIGRIARLGDEAIPALEQELHLGIKFRDLNRALQAGQSRRYAVVQVLAQIPGERSTDLLVRSRAREP